MILLWSAIASADEVEDWVHLQDVLLFETAYAESTGAISGYERLVRDLPAESVVRLRALYQLGYTKYTLGDIVGAREALRSSVQYPHPARSMCLDLLSQIELEQASIRTIPTSWSFDAQTGGVIHPARYADKGTVRIDRSAPGGDPALLWTTTIESDRDDLLEIGFDKPNPPPQGFRMAMRSTALDARLRLVAVDIFGRRYVLGGENGYVTIPRNVWSSINVRFDQLVPIDSSNSLSSRLLDRLLFQDVSAYFHRTTEMNSLYFDDFSVY